MWQKKSKKLSQRSSAGSWVSVRLATLGGVSFFKLEKISARKNFSKFFKMRRQPKAQISLKSYSKNLSDSSKTRWETSKNFHPENFAKILKVPY